MLRTILRELKEHAPFTTFGALTGIVVMILFHELPQSVSYKVFYTLHPLHVLFSALVTTAIFKRHKCGQPGSKCNLLALVAIGYAGSVGIATLSDSIIPYLGETLLRMPNRGIHLGFIEEWQIVNPLAAAGIAIAYFRPRTKLPHSMHVLLSTWASLFHVILAVGGQLHWLTYLAVFFFLLIAVWLPCCVSDIVFPLLFTGEPAHEKH
jgi:hypothetical protein